MQSCWAVLSARIDSVFSHSLLNIDIALVTTKYYFMSVVSVLSGGPTWVNTCHL